MIFSTVRYDETDLRDFGIWKLKQKGIADLAADTDGHKIDERLEIGKSDSVLLKKYASCFFGTDLVPRLMAAGVDTLIMTGCTTSGCVRATAVDSVQNGFRPVVVREGVGDRSKAAHDQSLFDLNAKYADVVPLEEALQYLRQVGHNSMNAVTERPNTMSERPNTISEKVAAPATHGRFKYSAIVDRPQLRWPNGARVALWVIPNIEHFLFDRPSTSITPITASLVPDVLNYSWRDYGVRVGVWRMMEVMEKYRVKGTVALNSDVCAEYPRIIEAGNELGWEWMGHGKNNSTLMSGRPENEERAMI